MNRKQAKELVMLAQKNGLVDECARHSMNPRITAGQILMQLATEDMLAYEHQNALAAVENAVKPALRDAVASWRRFGVRAIYGPSYITTAQEHADARRSA